jgi:hypothetical protein
MNDHKISLGSQYAELDNKLAETAIQLPVFEQVNGPFPAIVYGEEGMGKTACALMLMKKSQILAELDNVILKIFPVYAPFEMGVDVKEFLIDRVSCALIDFIADNPRRFLNAPDARKKAMGRLMLRNSKDTDTLHLDLFKSPLDPSVEDLNQVLDYISKLKGSPSVKLTRSETLNLLYLAYPDAFDQVYFLWDIRSADPNEEVLIKIKEIDSLALPLARQNLFIKIFAPLKVKTQLARIASFSQINELVWTETQLRDLLESRIKMFDALWERGIDDPVGLVIAKVNHSPRRLIQILHALLEYVDKHFQEENKLNKVIFSEVTSIF